LHCYLLACDGFEYLRRQFRVSLGNDIMTSGATGVFNGMAPLAGLSCDLSRIIANDKPPQAEHVQRGARFCGKLSDFRFDQDTFVGLQAEGLCRPDAAVPPAPVRSPRHQCPNRPPSDQPEVEAKHKVQHLNQPVLRQLRQTLLQPNTCLNRQRASTQPVGENAAAEPAVDPAKLQYLLSQL
jgi:hypothetical protein